MKKFIPNSIQRREGQKTQYAAYDPKLTFGGGDIASIHSQPMRFLGKFIFTDLKDHAIRQSVKDKLAHMLKTTDKSQLNGIMKMWIYNNAIIPKLTWEFIIHNFPITFLKNPEATCTKHLK